jgi:hypothetical protein
MAATIMPTILKLRGSPMCTNEKQTNQRVDPGPIRFERLRTALDQSGPAVNFTNGEEIDWLRLAPGWRPGKTDSAAGIMEVK